MAIRSAAGFAAAQRCAESGRGAERSPTRIPETRTVMKTQSQPIRRFQLKLHGYANGYYIERVERLDTAIARKPRSLQIDLIGVGEIPADTALLLRSILMDRSPNTRLITRARSSLTNGSVLIWLLGDTRLIRDDARVFFRRPKLSEDGASNPDETWTEGSLKLGEPAEDIDPEEGDYARVLQLINEFLPVQEMAGRLIGVPVLKEFGLVENEQVDRFLAAALGPIPEPAPMPSKRTRAKGIRGATRASRSRQIRR